MFWLLTIIYVSIDVYSLSNAEMIIFDLTGTLSQLQILIALMCGMMAATNTTAKRKAVMIILFLGASMVFFTGMCLDVADWVYWIEIIIYTVGIIWAGARPYEFISDPINKDTVCILFYKANSGSWLMHTFSLIGLPVSSMSIVCGDYWLKLVRSRPGLEIHVPQNIDSKYYIVVDTGIKKTDRIMDIMRDLQGTPAVSLGSFGLRVRCIAVVKPLLKEMGSEWVPKTILQKIPSLYFYKALWNRQNRI